MDFETEDLGFESFERFGRDEGWVDLEEGGGEGGAEVGAVDGGVAGRFGVVEVFAAGAVAVKGEV